MIWILLTQHIPKISMDAEIIIITCINRMHENRTNTEQHSMILAKYKITPTYSKKCSNTRSPPLPSSFLV